jgi:hypothetical protein
MATAKRADNLAIMQMALAGYEVEKQRIEEKIREINSLLGGKRIKPGPTSGATKASAKPRARRELSAAARKRIAAAQRKRWEEYRKNKAQGAGA